MTISAMRDQPTEIRESSSLDTDVFSRGGIFPEVYLPCPDGVDRKICFFGPGFHGLEVLQRRAGSRLRPLKGKEAWAWVMGVALTFGSKV